MTKPQLQVSKYYNGYLHYFTNVGFGLVGITFCIKELHEFKWSYLVVILLAFFIASLVEYLGHRYLLHINHKNFKVAYNEHTLSHHSYFTHEDLVFHSHKEIKKIIFAFYAIVFFIFLIGIPIAILVGLIFGKDYGLIMMSFELLYFIIYENIHLIDHLSENHFLFKIQYLKKMRLHHLNHHNPKWMMTKNFGIVSPIFDRV